MTPKVIRCQDVAFVLSIAAAVVKQGSILRPYWAACMTASGAAFSDLFRETEFITIDPCATPDALVNLENP